MIRLSRRGKALILLYHRVTEVETDPWQLAVSPSRFSEHLGVLAARTRPVHLRELACALRDGEWLTGRRPPAVVTFDDGYADNLEMAKPLLERAGIPATVFIVSGVLGRRRGFWWDELARALLAGESHPSTLRVSTTGRQLEWKLRGENREEQYREVWKDIRALPVGERELAVAEIVTACGPAAEDGRDRMLRPEELMDLTAGGLIEVGAHTDRHPVLAELAPSEQRAEIDASKRQLEKVLRRTVFSFSYPHGQVADFTDETVSAVRAAGFACACTAFGGPVRPGADLFRLPRLYVRDWDQDIFARRLDEWLVA